jgi:hypothetical protein
MLCGHKNAARNNAAPCLNNISPLKLAAARRKNSVRLLAKREKNCIRI